MVSGYWTVPVSRVESGIMNPGQNIELAPPGIVASQ
jgi:translation elongation factor EF-1alpha